MDAGRHSSLASPVVAGRAKPTNRQTELKEREARIDKEILRGAGDSLRSIASVLVCVPIAFSAPVASQRACGACPRTLRHGRLAQPFGMLVNEFRRCALLHRLDGANRKSEDGHSYTVRRMAVIMLTSQLICGCSTFLSWLSTG
jgi:hypothetical protein